MSEWNDYWKRRLEQTQINKEKGHKVKTEKQQVAPEQRFGSNYIEVVDITGKTIRVYSRRDHGPNYAELARQFTEKHRYVYFDKNPNLKGSLIINQ